MQLCLDRNIKKLNSEAIAIQFLSTGDISEIKAGKTRINTLVGNNANGSDTNIYLRVFKNNEIKYSHLMGVNSNSVFNFDNNTAVFKGEFENVTYVLKVNVINNKWFFDVKLNGNGEVCDVIYAQPLMLSAGGSEFYNAQYTDNKVFEDSGYHLCSRYTLNGEFAQVGSLNTTVAYSTDGFQFYGLNYKKDNVIGILKEEHLKNENYQYENILLAVQSEKLILNLDSAKNVVFYGLHESGKTKSTSKCIAKESILADYECVKDVYPETNNFTRVELAVDVNNVLAGLELTQNELNELYPTRILVEEENNELLSFFTPTYEHIVLPTKELKVERTHGHIVFNRQLDFAKPVMASTQYMTGIFNSHVVVGNTNVNKFTSDFRNYLNTFKTSGQRFIIKIKDEYKMLTMPSVYEMGFNYSRWVYKLENDSLVITTYTTDETPEIITTFESNKGVNYDIIILNEITLGENERDSDVLYNKIENGVEFTPSPDSFISSKYPNIKYTMLLDKQFELETDRILFADNQNRNEPFVFITLRNVSSFKLVTLGQRDEEKIISTNMSFELAKTGYETHFNELLNHFKLKLASKNIDVEKYNAITRWYTHNMLTHYSTPHGLEQYGGAAWGTRDVCQGPVEYFLSTQKYDLVRKILKELFRHQYIEDGNWPQWFMFDKFTNIQQLESHGDIIVWPMRTLALYLKTTGDYSILDEKIAYTKKEDFSYTTTKETLLEHIKKEVKYIVNTFIEGTSLPCYGEGDWNDSMQPANKALRSSMVSGWTSILAFETFTMFANEIKTIDSEYSEYLSNISMNIKEDYNKYIIKDGVPAGFGLYKNGEFRHIIHPTDTETKIKYRLLCINRGIISEMYTAEQAKNLYNIAINNLYREDGAILFSDCVTYRGGENTYFQRAEQSSNVGREIGLHYVHAHLRFIEALNKLGKVDKVWEAIDKVTPIQIKDSVSNAVYRQANSYFSSSDANTLDRYEYMEKFEDVKLGKVDVKGGWRIYSSGPGIYINQLISNTLGFAIKNKDLVLAPLLDTKFDGLQFNYMYFGNNITINYIVKNNDCCIKNVKVNGIDVTTEIEINPYGKQTSIIKSCEFEKLLREENNIIDIFI